MKYIVSMMIGLFLFGACRVDDPVFFDNSLGEKDVKMLGIRADHRMMLPDELSSMRLRAVAYGMTDLMEYTSVTVPSVKDPTVDTVIYYDQLKCDTFEIAEDLYPKEWIKIYDENDREVEGGYFRTLDTTPRTIYFYARAGELVSQRFPVKIRPLPKEEYEEVVFPVIFHVLTPPAKDGISFEISSEGLQKKLDRLNDIFNRRATRNPNGGNAKITFKLALYSQKGMLLEHPGRNQTELSQSFDNQKVFEEFLFKNYMWNPKDYLNVWVVKNEKSDAWSVPDKYVAKSPRKYSMFFDPVPGLAMIGIDPNSWTAENIYDGGVLVNYQSFFNPGADEADLFEFATAFGVHFGLLATEVKSDASNIVEGDTDYCPDTYYSQGGQQSLYKNNNYKDKPDGRVEYFTSFHIMELYSYKNSVTVDQVRRMRRVIEQCPSCWAYRSDWAFTGKR